MRERAWDAMRERAWGVVLRLVRWVASGLVAVLAAAWGVAWLADPGSHAAALVRAVTAPGSAVSGVFSLVDTVGRPVTDAAFRGRWMLVYFGYAYCPDVCPTILQTMVGALDLLGPAAAAVVPVFITVDPARDTPTALGEYVKLFDPRLIGLTGTAAQVAAAERAYGVHSNRAATLASGYLIDHTSYVYLVGPKGSLRKLFPAGTNEADMAQSIAATMADRG